MSRRVQREVYKERGRISPGGGLREDGGIAVQMLFVLF